MVSNLELVSRQISQLLAAEVKTGFCRQTSFADPTQFNQRPAKDLPA
jgi:hypothetical protein